MNLPLGLIDGFWLGDGGVRLADPLGLVGLAVPEEDVHHAVAVGPAGQEVAGRGVEDHEPAVGADPGPEAALVGLRSAGGDADPLGVAAAPVADEDVGHAVGVAGHEVRGVGLEGDEVAVGRDRRRCGRRRGETGGLATGARGR